MQGLQAASAQFTSKKDKILQLLAVPDTEYSDASPKGSVDVGIRDLINEVNAIEGLVTTSSCAGRVSVFVEGKKAIEDGEDSQIASTVGGKGGGGAWLLVSHDPVPENEDWIKSLQLTAAGRPGAGIDGARSKRWIHFKFEPMVSISMCMNRRLVSCANDYPDLARSSGVTLTCPTHSTMCSRGWIP